MAAAASAIFKNAQGQSSRVPLKQTMAIVVLLSDSTEQEAARPR